MRYFAPLSALGIVAVGCLAAYRQSVLAPVDPALYVLAALLGIGAPLAAFIYALRRRRIAGVVLALGVGLSVNVIYAANALPAMAATDNSGQFWLGSLSDRTFGCGSAIFDMEQSSANVSSNTTRGGGAGLSYSWCSDTFAASQSLVGGTTIATAYLSNTSNSKTCDYTGELLWWHGASSTFTSLGVSATQTIPTDVISQPYTWSWATSTVPSFADGDRLYFTFTFTGAGSNCNSADMTSGVTYPSNVTVATIVPENVVALLPLAIALPIAARWWKRRRP